MDEWFERSPFVGFAPWIIYSVVPDGPSTWMFGAVCAVTSALILGAHDRDWMDRYATTLSSGVLAVMALGSLAFTPFTVDWTKAVIPAVVIIGAVGMTQIYPARARANARPEGAA